MADSEPLTGTSLNALLANVASRSTVTFGRESPFTYGGMLSSQSNTWMQPAPAFSAPETFDINTHVSRLLAEPPTQTVTEEPEPRRRSRRVAARAAREHTSGTSTVHLNVPKSTSKKRSAAARSESPRRKKARAIEDVTSDSKSRKAKKKPPPNAKDDAKYDTEDHTKKDNAQETCCICMSVPERQDLAGINGCDHNFCFDCIAKWGERENTCPLCKCRFTKISRVHKAKRRQGVKNPPNTKQVRERNQRSDLVSGAALEAMLNSIAASNRTTMGGAAMGAPRVSRLLLAMGSGPLASLTEGSSRPTSRRAAFFVEEGVIDSDEDASDGDLTDSPFHGFRNELIRHTMRLSRRRVPGSTAPIINLDQTGFAAPMMWPMPPTYPPGFPSAPVAHGLFPPQPTQRSYAVNMNDSNAGRAAENPLEIDDSDDDDDVVEVISPPSLL